MCSAPPPPPKPVQLPPPVAPVEPAKLEKPQAPPPPSKTAESFGRAKGTKLTANYSSSDGSYKSLIIPRSTASRYTALNIPGAR